MSDDGLPIRRVLRRLESYEPSVEEYNVKGKPLSKLEITGLQMRAKGRRNILLMPPKMAGLTYCS